VYLFFRDFSPLECQRTRFCRSRRACCYKIPTHAIPVFTLDRSYVAASATSAVVVYNKRAVPKNNTNYPTTMVFRIITPKLACFIS